MEAPEDKLTKPDLRSEMKKELLNWRIGTAMYGFTYYASRIVLIVASALVAAKETLSGGYPFIKTWIPGVAVLVAILTAFDTWLKPQQKWRGFMEARDALTDLFLQMKEGRPTSNVRAAFLELRRKHRDRSVF